jgi:NAD+ diphosphatase
MGGSERPSRLGYVSNGLVRSGVENDPEAFLRHSREPGARAIAILGEQALLSGPDGAATALLPREALPLDEALEIVALGFWDGAPVVGADLPLSTHDSITAGLGFRLTDLRSAAVQGLVPPHELGALAQAKSLLSWHARHRFCANCGQRSASRCAGLRRDCQACGTQHFPRTDPVSIMLVARGDECLLGRQRRFVPGSYSCLAGFVSPGETLEDAVRREVLEEAGIAVGRVTYAASQPWPFPSSLMIGCLAEALTDAITLDEEELEDARWFGRDEVAAMLERRHPDGLITPPPMAIAHHLLGLWLAGSSP